MIGKALGGETELSVLYVPRLCHIATTAVDNSSPKVQFIQVCLTPVGERDQMHIAITKEWWKFSGILAYQCEEGLHLFPCTKINDSFSDSKCSASEWLLQYLLGGAQHVNESDGI